MKLKLCPFCGGYPEIIRTGTSRRSMIISCEDCGCTVESGDIVGLTEPKDWSWNTRYTTDKLFGEVFDES